MPTERDAVGAFIRSGDDNYGRLTSLMALGLMVFRKWDRANKTHPAPNPAEVAAFDDFTETEAREFAASAAGLLRDYVALVPRAEPQSFWLPVWQGVLSAFLYSVLLVTLAVMVRFGGHDLVDILRDALKPG